MTRTRILRKVLSAEILPSLQRRRNAAVWYRLKLECGHTALRKGKTATVVCRQCRRVTAVDSGATGEGAETATE